MLVGISNVRIYREREKYAACDAKKSRIVGHDGRHMEVVFK